MRIVADENIPFAAEALGSLGEVTLLPTHEITPGSVRGADALIIRSETKVNRARLDGSAVRFVGTSTIGTDHIDTGYLADRGIAFTSAPGSNANSVKEYVLAALLAVCRRLGWTLEGRTLGVVGVGNIGRRVATMAEKLGMRVLRNDPPLARQTGDPLYHSLDELMEADILTLHVPLTRDGQDPTLHLFNAARLRSMKRDAVLINSSRGPVVDNAALAEVLAGGYLGAAVLDVWEGEPRLDPGLLASVAIGTPHVAGYSLDGKVNAIVMVRAGLAQFARAKPSWNPASLLPPGPAGPISVAAGSAEGALEAAVLAFYDILRDDRDLRPVLRLPEQQRPAFFQGLRTAYRIRREFSTAPVRLEGSARVWSQRLRAAGFAVVEEGEEGA
jgi:erythronate-4-phosphate dehydrogenase